MPENQSISKIKEIEESDVPETIPLHWKRDVPRRGLGNLLMKANHIAITVSDVGRALWFYSDVLGFQQIRRPNFDRHGAWLTMGNVELHLILGKPVVPSGKDLIVGHISLETNNIAEVLRRLKEMEIPFETNVSVPKAEETEGIVTQYFFRDPDGYYVEICNCDILTKFCLGDDKLPMIGYEEGAKPGVTLAVMVQLAAKAQRAKNQLRYKEDDLAVLKKFDEVDCGDVVVDEPMLKNLVKRTTIYGDVCQGEDEESLRQVLKKTRNNAPDAIRYIDAKHGEHQLFIPPTIYKDNEEEFKPAAFEIPHEHNHAECDKN